MRTLVYDTETTGLWNFKSDFTDPDQPRPVQIAGILFDDRTEVSSFNILINSEVESHPKALEVHKKTPELLKQFGLVESTAIAILRNFIKRADRLVAHNASYDYNIVQAGYYRSQSYNECIIPSHVQPICTMISATQICRIPNPNGRPGFKWPKLEEAYPILVDEKGFADAHDALADTRACAQVLFALEDLGVDLKEIKL